MSHISTDPRVARSRRVIRRAALTELAEAGYGGFTLESVATRAGVGRSTVYRHWTGKTELIADALETLNVQPADEALDGTARDRVETLLGHLAEVLAGSPFADCLPALVHAAEQDETVREFLHGYSARRRQALTDTIAEGVATGEFPGSVDPDLASQALSGALFYRRFLTGSPFAPAEVGALIDSVLAL